MGQDLARPGIWRTHPGFYPTAALGPRLAAGQLSVVRDLGCIAGRWAASTLCVIKSLLYRAVDGGAGGHDTVRVVGLPTTDQPPASQSVSLLGGDLGFVGRG